MYIKRYKKGPFCEGVGRIFYFGKFRCAHPCVAKSCAERPVFYTGGRGAGCSRIQVFAQRGHKANASSGAQSEAPGRSCKSGDQQQPGLEN